MAALRCSSPPLSTVAHGNSIAATAMVQTGQMVEFEMKQPVLPSGSSARPWSPTAVAMMSSAKAVGSPLPMPTREPPTRSPIGGRMRETRQFCSPSQAERAMTPSRGSPTRSIRPLTPSPGPSRAARGLQASSPPLSRIAAAAVGTPRGSHRDLASTRTATPPRSSSPSQQSMPSYAPVVMLPEATALSLSEASCKPAGELRVGSRARAFYQGEWFLGTIVLMPEDNKAIADVNKQGSYTLQCDVDEPGVLTYTRQVVAVEECSEPMQPQLAQPEQPQLAQPVQPQLVPPSTDLVALAEFVSLQMQADCSNCGNVFVPDSVFCRICGRKRAYVTSSFVTPPSLAVDEPLPTRAVTNGSVSKHLTMGSIRAPLQLSGSTHSVAASIAHASSSSSVTCPPSLSALLSPRLTPLTSQSNLAHIVSPRQPRAVVMSRPGGIGEVKLKTTLAKEYGHRLAESCGPPSCSAKSLQSRRELRASRKETRDSAQVGIGRRARQLVQDVEEQFHRVEEAMEELQAFRFSSEENSFRQSSFTPNKDPVCSLCGSQRRLEPEAGFPPAVSSGSLITPSPASGIDGTVDGVLLTSEVPPTLEAHSGARLSEGTLTKLSSAMERSPRFRKEAFSDVRPYGGVENGEVDVREGMHLTPINDKPFQALSSIARQAHSVLVERLTPRAVVE